MQMQIAIWLDCQIALELAPIFGGRVTGGGLPLHDWTENAMIECETYWIRLICIAVPLTSGFCILTKVFKIFLTLNQHRFRTDLIKIMLINQVIKISSAFSVKYQRRIVPTGLPRARIVSTRLSGAKRGTGATITK